MYTSIILLILLVPNTSWPSQCTFPDIRNSLEYELSTSHIKPARTFRLDPSQPQFLKDGQPFRFVGGQFNYFHSLPGSWQRKLRTMRAAGLNVVSTYVEWSLHNPHDGVYQWTGPADAVRFVQLAALECLLVVLRPAPYICAEREMGGFPYWLLAKYPQIHLRSMDADYVREVQRWNAEMMPRFERLLYENGGPIIMVQVENEYGSYECDAAYRLWMRDEMRRHVSGKALLYTNDGPPETPCGKIPDVLGTLDFGAFDLRTIDKDWDMLRLHERTGPLVNMEWYTGWLTHWQEPMAIFSTDILVKCLRHMLQQNASVNIYMFYGGTNFGFTAGANNNGPGLYDAALTSYDYDAPMDEAGDPTAKYYALRQVIADFLPLPNLPRPVPLPKWRLAEPFVLQPVAELVSPLARYYLGTVPILSHQPDVSFEQLLQHSGFVLYETQLPARFKADPSVLRIERLHDRAIVLADGRAIGTLSREQCVAELPVGADRAGQRLQVLVENQGRITFEVTNDFKGILSNVTLNGWPLLGWTITGYPLEHYEQMAALVEAAAMAQKTNDASSLSAREGYSCNPAVFHGTFVVKSDETELFDTYLDTVGWGKGVAFVNGFNVGRYWPLVGPQRTMYVPRELLHYGVNDVTLVELQRFSSERAITFVDKPILDEF